MSEFKVINPICINFKKNSFRKACSRSLWVLWHHLCDRNTI